MWRSSTHELRAVEAELARPEVTADLARMDRVLARQQVVLDRWVERRGTGPGGGGARAAAFVRLRRSTTWRCPRPRCPGGQRKLVALAACLIRQPDLLLLDEPETHLDADRRVQLEDLIAEFPGGVVVVSHDRYLLDETVDADRRARPTA